MPHRIPDEHSTNAFVEVGMYRGAEVLFGSVVVQRCTRSQNGLLGALWLNMTCKGVVPRSG